MPTYRADFYFQEFGQGWLETWYLSSSGIDSALSLAIVGMAGLLAPRASTVASQGVKVSQVEPPSPRTTLRDPAPGNGQLAVGTSSVLAEDVVQTCVLATVRTAVTIKRSLMIRGMLDGVTLRFPTNGEADFGLLNGPLATMKAALLLFGAQIRSHDPAAAGGLVTSFDADPTNAGVTRVNTNSVAGIVAGDKVTFKRVPKKQLPWLKGAWKVISITGSTFDIGYPYPYAAATPAPLASWSRVQWLYTNITNMTPQDLRSRKTGRPLRVTAGRAKGISFRR